MPRRVFCAGAFLMDFLAAYPVLPTHRSILSQLRAMPTYVIRRNATKSLENIVRMEQVKIVTRYN